MIADFHNDFLTKYSLSDCQKYLNECERARVKIIFASIFTTEFKGDKFKQVKAIINKARKLKTSIKLLIHIEDAGFITPENLEEFLSLGIYSCGIVWNYKNGLGAGAYASGGLTKFGKVVINKFIDKGILIDLAHANRKTFYDIIKICQKRGVRVVDTHTAFNNVFKHPRNITTTQIKSIISLGGLVGLAVVSEFLNGTNEANKLDFDKHLNWFVKHFGAQNIVLGSDFCGTDKLPIGLKTYADFKNYNQNFTYNNLANFIESKN